jgi:O-acetyl-ADP-ribose deacetylase (regulator of RNase III)
MGKGLALQLKQALPEMFRAYAQAAKAGRIVVGRMHVHGNPELAGPRFIINVPTKLHWRNPSRLEWIDQGLDDLKLIVRELGINSIALPALGCGLGGLAWADVFPLIERAAAAIPDIDVRVYAPRGE